MALNLGSAIAYLQLDMSNFINGLDDAGGLLEDFADGTVSSVDGALTAIGDTATSIGNSLTQSVTMPIVEMGESALDAYRSYETAFTGVKKTLDVAGLSAEQTSKLYDQLSENIENMAMETASSAEEIAGVMEVAGQLGIVAGESGENITRFTKTMVMLGDTTNLTAEDAATYLAQFMNVAQTADDEVENLGATIVDLGNKFATNERDIVKMSQRLASAGTVAGLTEQEILALSTTMLSTGINVEAGASAMSQTLAGIEKITQKALYDTSEAGDTARQQLQILADTAGMTAEEFADAWETRPSEALQAFLVGMGNLEEMGESTVMVLDELGMSGIRQSNMLRAVGLAGEELTRAIGVANVAWDENNALVTEAELRYGTLDSQISQLNEGWKALQRDLAEVFVPILIEIMDYVKQAIEWFRGLSDETKESIVKFAGIAAVVGPVLTVFGTIVGTVGRVIGAFKSFWMVLEPVRLMISEFATFQGLINAINAGPLDWLMATLKNIGTNLLSKGGPVAAIALLIAGFARAFAESEDFRESIGQLFGAIKKVGEAIWEIISAVGKALWPVIDALVDIVSDLLQILLPPLIEVIDFLADIIKQVADLLAPVIEALGTILKPVLEAIRVVLDLIATVLGWIIEKIASVVEILSGAIKVIVSLLTGDLDEAVDGIFQMVEGLFGFLGELPGRLFDIVGNIIQGAVDGLKSAWEGFLNIWKNLWNGLVDVVTGLFGIHSPSTLMHGFLVNVVEGAEEGLEERGPSLIEKMGNLARNVFDRFANTASSIAGKVPEAVSGVMDRVVSVVGGFGKALYNVGSSAFNFLWDGMKSVWERISGWASSAFNGLKNLFGNISSGIGSIFSRISGSHAAGLTYVPFDGYVAELHQGERVLTKNEAREYDNRVSEKTGDTFNFYNTKPDPYEYARQMKRAKREILLG